MVIDDTTLGFLRNVPDKRILRHDIDEINDILSAAVFNPSLALKKIRDVNDRYPDNIEAHSRIRSHNAPPLVLVLALANHEDLRSDLSWKLTYLQMKVKGLEFDQIVKVLQP